MNQKILSLRAKRPALAFTVTVCLCAGWALMATTNATAALNESNANVPIAYETNEAGQTFGTCLTAGTSEQMPDLVLVVATNGKEGYVYRDDLEEAEGAGVETPEEAVKLTEESDRKFREGFTESLASRGYELSEEAVDAVIEEARYGAGVEAAIADCVDGFSSEVNAMPEARARENARASVVEDDVAQAIQDGIESAAVSITVYSEDGKTAIGEFLVGGI